MKLGINDRVRIKTATGGCYHEKTGVITRILNPNLTPINLIPERSPDANPYWYQVRFDTPADNGGKPVIQEIFTRSELTKL